MKNKALGSSGNASIFVSHCHSDKEVAGKLRDCLVESLNLNRSDIRCTSVPGSKGRYGEFSKTLREDIDECKIVLVLLTQSSIKSTWVQNEIGASWALNKDIVPILGPGLGACKLSGPLSGCKSIVYDDISDDRVSKIVELISYIGNENGFSLSIDDWVTDRIYEFWSELESVQHCEDYCDQNKILRKKKSDRLPQDISKDDMVLCHIYFNVIKNSELDKVERAIENFFKNDKSKVYGPTVWSLLGSMEIVVTFRSGHSDCKSVLDRLDEYVESAVQLDDAVRSEQYILESEFIRHINSFTPGRNVPINPLQNHRSTFAFIKLKRRENAPGEKIDAIERIDKMLRKQLSVKEDFIVDRYGVDSCKEYVILEIQIPCGYQDSLKVLSQDLESELVYWDKNTFIVYHAKPLYEV